MQMKERNGKERKWKERKENGRKEMGRDGEELIRMAGLSIL